MKKKIVWGIGALLLLASVGYFVSTGKQAVAVEMTTVEKGSIERIVEEKAEVKLTDESQVYSLSAGIVTQVNAAVGDKVKKGDVLVQFDTEGTTLQIKGLQAQLDTVSAQYAEASSPSKNSEISKLNALVNSAQLAYDEAKKTESNNKALLEAGGISQDVYQATLTDLATKEASLLTAKSNLNTAKSGLSDNVKAQYSAQLEGLHAQLALLEKQLSDLQLTAPEDGIVLALNAKVGNYIQPGTQVLVIGDTQHKYLTTDILVDEIDGVEVGSPVHIDNKDLGIVDQMGTVSKIFPIAFNKMSELGILQKRVTVEIEFDEQLADLKPGYELTAKIVVESHSDALLVDKKAVFDYQGSDHVFMNVNGVATLKEVVKGISTDKKIEILEGLGEGDRIILSPDDTVHEGLKIK